MIHRQRERGGILSVDRTGQMKSPNLGVCNAEAVLIAKAGVGLELFLFDGQKSREISALYKDVCNVAQRNGPPPPVAERFVNV